MLMRYSAEHREQGLANQQVEPPSTIWHCRCSKGGKAWYTLVSPCRRRSTGGGRVRCATKPTKLTPTFNTPSASWREPRTTFAGIASSCHI